MPRHQFAGFVAIVSLLLISTLGTPKTVTQAPDTQASAAPPDAAALAIPISGVGGDTIIDTGPHHRVIQRIRQIGKDQDGPILETNTFTQLETGLNYLNTNSLWVAASEAIRIVDGGALADQGQTRVLFNWNANATQAIQMTLMGGQRMVSHVFGLAYYDPASGQSVMISGVQDCQGAVLDNRVLYPNAFETVSGSIRYTYKKASFTQDIILTTAPPPPEAYGLSPDSRLEIWTEWVETVQPTIGVQVLNAADVANGSAGPLLDEALDFGEIRMGDGQTLWLGDDGSPQAGVAVQKSWIQLDGRTFLVEGVSVKAIAGQLGKLPSAKAAILRKPSKDRRTAWNSVPPRRSAAPSGEMRRAAAEEMEYGELPSGSAGQRALALDYTTLSSGYTNYTLGASTYWATGPVTFSGTNLNVEAGCVVKLAATNNAGLVVNAANVNWRGSIYRPIVITAADDQTIGQTVGTNAVNGYYGGTALYLDAGTNLTSYSLTGLRIANANNALAIKGNANHVLAHLQIVKAKNGLLLTNTSVSIRNILLNNVLTNLTGSGATGAVEHLTSDGAIYFNTAGAFNSLAVTNSLLVGVANTTQFTAVAVSSISNPVGVFQTVGAASHYLVWDSPQRGTGVTNINSSLIADFPHLTTRAPMILNQAFTANTNLSPRALRENPAAPDRGYLYPAIDFAMSNLDITNSTLTLTGGVVVAFYGGGGVNLKTGGSFVSQGGPGPGMNHLIRSHAVQEQSTFWGTNASSFTFINGSAILRFTEVSCMADTISKTYLLPSSIQGTWSFKDSWLRGVYATITSTATSLEGWTNNLFEASTISISQVVPYQNNCYLLNNLFRNSSLTLSYTSSSYGTWSINDNLFDGCTVIAYTNTIPNSKNAYTGSVPVNLSGLALTNLPLSYLKGPFGDFYYSTNGGPGSLTNLIDYDAIHSPASVGLYHYTTKLDQTKELAGPLDVGMHFVSALNGVSQDLDGDGLPDYLEDVNGDGVANNGETNWQTPDSDYDGRTDFDELYGDYTNPNSSSGTNARPVRLGLWRFNNTSTGEQGQTATDVNTISYLNNSWEGPGLPPGVSVSLREATGTSKRLGYPEYGSGGRPNLNPRCGTARFWFLPNWNQGSRIVNNSTQTRFCLLCMSGTTANEYWGLEFDANGTHLTFCLTNNSGAFVTVLQATGYNIFTNKSLWHQIALSYSTTNALIYLDGAIAASNSTTALAFLPWSQSLSRKVYLGGDPASNLANGDYDYLETFNYQLSAQTIANDYSTIFNRDSDGDSLTDLTELLLGTNPGNPDTDGDGMPDGWEVAFSRNPLSGTNSTWNVDGDSADDYHEYLRGTNPNIPDDPGSPSYFLVGNQANLFNLDFGNGTAATGPAAAGFDASDFWVKMPAGHSDAMLTNSAGGLSSHAVTLRYGPLIGRVAPGEAGGAWPGASVDFCTWVSGNPPGYNGLVCCPAIIHYWLDVNYWYFLEGCRPYYCNWPFWRNGNCVLVVKTPPINPPQPNPPPPTGPWPKLPPCFPIPVFPPADDGPQRNWYMTNGMGSAWSCQFDFAHFDSQSSLDDGAAASNYQVTWLPAYDVAGNFANPTGVSANAMFNDYLVSSVDTNLCSYESATAGYFLETGKATAEIALGPLDEGNYYLYLYSSQAGAEEIWPTRFIVNNSITVDVPRAGYARSAFASKVNYARVLVQPVASVITIKSRYRNSVINGLQLVQLGSLTAPQLFAGNSSKQLGAWVTWAAVPYADSYLVYRADSGASYTNYTQIGQGTVSPFFKDVPKNLALDYRYRVQAVNEAGSGPLSAAVTVAFSGMPGYTGPSTVVSLRSIRVLRQAYRGTPFMISSPTLRAAADVTGPSSTEIGFRILRLDGGTLQMAALDANGVPGAFTNVTDAVIAGTNRIILNSKSIALWTPPGGGGSADIVDAFQVQAVSNAGCSVETNEVKVLTKQPTALYVWGDKFRQAVGDGTPSAFGFYGHEQAEALANNIFPFAWSSDPNPVVMQVSGTNGIGPAVTNVLKVIHDGLTGAALTSSGQILTWGSGQMAMLGNGIYYTNAADPTIGAWFPYEQTFAKPAVILTNAVDVAFGANAFAVKSDGTVWAWGMDWGLDLFLGSYLPPCSETSDGNAKASGTNTPVQLAGLSGISAVSASDNGCLVLGVDGSLQWWGQWGITVTTKYSSDNEVIDSAGTPTTVSVPGRVVQIAAGNNHFVALTDSGAVYTWGLNDQGQLGYTTTNNGSDEATNYKKTPRQLPGIGSAIMVAAGGSHTLILLADGTVRQWGVLSDYSPAAFDLTGLTNITSVSTGGNHALAVDGQGQIWGWGLNWRGELGETPDLDGLGLEGATALMVFVPVLQEALVDSELAVASPRPITYGVSSLSAPFPRELRALPGDSQVTLRWRHFPGARTYRVWRTTIKGGVYEWLMDVPDDPSQSAQVAIDTATVNYAEYYYEVSGIVGNTETINSPPVAASPIPKPGQVGSVTAAALSRQASLSWAPVSNASRYEVWRGIVTTNKSRIAIEQGNSNPISILDTGLTPSTTYYYNIRATNASGPGLFRGSDIVVTLGAGSISPAAPGNLTATPEEGAIDITWDASTGSGTLYYRIKVCEQIPDYSTGSSTNFTPSGGYELVDVTTNTAETIKVLTKNGQPYPILNGHYYGVRVSTQDDTGEGPDSGDASVDTGIYVRPVPNSVVTHQPITVSMASVGNQCIYLRWSGMAVSYLVQISPTPPDGCGGQHVDTVIPDDNGEAEWWITGLQNGTAYRVNISQIWEETSEGLGAGYNIPNLRPSWSSLPAMPALLASPRNNDIYLSWPGSDQATTSTAFQGWRFVLLRRDTSNTNVSDACAHWGYSLWSPIADGTNGLCFDDMNAVNGVGYRYQLVAIGPEDPTQVTNVYSAAGGPNWIWPVATFPTNTVFTVTTTPFNAAAQISWNVITNANWYQVQRSTEDGGPYSLVASVSNATSYVDLGLANGGLYYYVITAASTNGDTYTSPQASVTPSPNYSPALPVNFTGSMGDGRVFISWDPTPFASFYQVNTNVTGFYRRVARPSFDYAYTTNSPTNAFQIAAGASVIGPTNTITVQAISWTGTNAATSYQVYRVLGGVTNLIGVTETVSYVDVRVEYPPAKATYFVNAYDASGALVASGIAASQALSTPTDVSAPTSAQTISSPSENADVMITLVGISGDTNSPTVITTPTNFVIRATVAALFAGTTPPSVTRVDFYSNGALLGSTTSSPFELEWNDPPGSVTGKTNKIVARMTDSTHRIKDSAPGYLVVKVVPVLSAFTTDATDVSLATRGLPLVFSRSYDSRTVGNGIFGPGWATSWDRARLQLPSMSDGWSNIWVVVSRDPFTMVETTSHRVTLLLPDGSAEYFQTAPDSGAAPPPLDGGDSDPFDDNPVFDARMGFLPVGETLGSLVENTANTSVEVSVESIYENASGMATLNRYGVPWAPDSFIYTSVDGTSYAYTNPTPTSSGNDLYLYAVTNRYGDWLRYDSTTVTNPDGSAGRKLTAITHSSGRALTFQDGTGGNAGYWCVYDPVATTGGTSPVVRYKVAALSANPNIVELTEVHRLTDRTGSSYNVTKFEYGFMATNSLPTNAVLARVISPEGVILLENFYKSDGSGFLDYQLDAIGIKKAATYTGADADGTFVMTNIISSSSGPVLTNLVTYASNGEAAGVQDGTGQTSNMGFDDKGRLAYTRDANGNFKSFVYDSMGRLVAASDGNGNSSTTSYGSSNQVLSVTDPLGKETGYTYYHYDDSSVRPAGSGDPEGALRRTSDPTGGAVEYHYNQYGQTTSEIRFVALSENSVTNQYGYSSGGDLLYVMDPLWASSSSNYHQTAYTYDANGARYIEVRNRRGVFRDPSGNNPGMTNQTLTTATIYDGQGRTRTNIVSSRTGASGSDDPGTQTTVTTYGPNGKPATTIDALNRTTSFTYDARGNLIETLYPDMTVQRSVYDALGRAIWSQDRSALTAVTNSMAPATQTIYDAAGRAISTVRWDTVALTKITNSFTTNVTDWTTQCRRSSGYTNIQYGMLASTTGGTALTYNRTAYDAAGRLVYTMDPNGHLIGYGYDAAGRRVSVTNYTATMINPVASGALVPSSSAGVVTAFSYDANGNELAMTNGLGYVTSYQYDGLNRCTATLLPQGLGETNQLIRYTVYDSLGRNSQQIDEAGIVTAYGYDKLGQLTSVTNDYQITGTNYVGTGLAITTYLYDEIGNLTNQTDALGRVTAYEYDGFGRRTRRTLPLGQFEVFGYDAAGNQLAQTNFLGLVITNNYDSMNRLSARWWGSTQLLAYAYAANGLRTGLTNASGVLTYGYNALSRMTSNVTPVGTLYYGYDAAGNLTSLGSATVNGVTNSYQYDALNRLTNVIDGRLDPTNNTTYAFDAAGNLQRLRYGNDVTNLYSYDLRNRLTNLVWMRTNAVRASFFYTLGPTGNRLTLADSVLGTNHTFTWSYDRLFRLTNEVIIGDSPTGGLAYAYDSVGNRLARTITGGLSAALTNQTLNFDLNDRLDNDSNPANGTAWFDAAGNTRTNGVDTCLFDWNNQLTNFSTGPVSVFYDGDGNRLKKIAGGTNTVYLVATVNPTGYAQVVEESTVSGGTTTLAKRYTHGLDLISQTAMDTSSTSWYGYDGLGSVRLAFKLNSTGYNPYLYDAYGNNLYSETSFLNWYRYAGEQWDAELHQYYLRRRTFSPNYGRFWTMDTFQGSRQDPVSLHKYLYCAGNPVNRIDPSGQDFTDVCIAIYGYGTLAASYAGPVLTAGRIALATITIAAFVADPDFRGEYVSCLGGPGTAATVLAADIRFIYTGSSGLVRGATAARNIITLRYNVGDAHDFQIKTADLKRAAKAGGLTVVSNPSQIRDATAQSAYRQAVKVRYTRYLQQLGMNPQQAELEATKKFSTLQADHRIDLQVSGDLSDPNDSSHLRMLDGSVNMSVGRQLANEIERLGLQTGDSIDDVVVEASQ